MRPLITSSVATNLVLWKATPQMRKVRGSAAATAAATLLAPHSSYAGVAAFSTFRQARQSNSVRSTHVSAIAFHPTSHVGSFRSFHTTAPTSKKKRNKWNAAKRYLAKMEEWEAEQNDEVKARESAEQIAQEQNSAAGVMDNREIDHEVDKESEESEEELYDDPPDSVVRSQTLDWIKEVVIGLNLCPFAALPLASNKLSIETIRGHDAESIAAAVLLELILRVDTPGTTIVVAPECSPDDFETYLEVLDFIEDIMEEHQLGGKVQVAPFHPLFEFGGRSDDVGGDDDANGIDNYTNRSPFPMFHVLREEEVGAAVDKLDGDASVVFDRNIRLMNMLYDKLGREGVEKVMSCKASENMKKAVEEVLKAVKKTNDINVN